MTDYRISELAAMVGLPPTTLRFYDRLGLLPAPRSPGGFRLYDDAIGRVRVISAGKYLGLPPQEIYDLLTALEGGLCAEVRDRLRPPLAARLEEARRQLAALATVTPCLADDPQHAPDRGAVACAGVPATVEPVLDAAPVPAESSCAHVPIACFLTSGDAAARVADWRRLLARARERCDVECGPASNDAPGLQVLRIVDGFER
ncbi:MerR family DNA-binding transcriptional regulator [Amycolatopsis sp. NPDC004625]|uniref:MerR family DNA-binding transcriptional regulator n=1 Tax=Amycolatopsis sp. NPDC004625 TaxID=3154670 RepID=UPI0033ACDDCB